MPPSLFRAAGAILVGSTTAGAAAPDDHNPSLYLPGDFQGKMSGIGVFYPGKHPLRRIGLVPDVPVKRTIAGIRAGRDEVLEEGLRQIIGPDRAAALIAALSKENAAISSPAPGF